MNNRRNFYRILHVQPEAPLEVIKASYRSLMTKLKMHPDLGGNHESAVLVNKAYAILSDPQRRRQYDEMLLRTGKSQDYGNTKHNPFSKAPEPHHRCIFCGTNLLSPQLNKYCFLCASPITPAKPIPNSHLGELFGRRAAPRIAKTGTLVIYPSWPHAGYSARLRDLSPSGINLLTEYGARAGQIIKFDSNNLNGIARIVSVRANGANFSVHAAFLTIEFMTKTGTFVKEKA
jgi:curved DNA-binding protein CbpA